MAGEGSIPETRDEYEAADPEEDTNEADVTPEEFVEPTPAADADATDVKPAFAAPTAVCWPPTDAETGGGGMACT